MGALPKVGRNMYRRGEVFARTIWWRKVRWWTGGGKVGQGILVGCVERRVWLGEERLELEVGKGDCL